ncbi:MAG TPA: biopolymer transporter ExbD [Planctomycetota bacterium]|nr:biopolymer transporter ExbD [Planctomycetota bacterium]
MRNKPRPAEETFSMTPMIDISFLLIIFFILLPLKGLDFKLECYLPRGDGGFPTTHQPKETVKIHVRQEGDALVYALGQHRAEKPEALAPVIRALGKEYAYEIDSTPTIPWRYVVDAVDVLASEHCEDVRFRGTRLPGRNR